MQCEFAYRGRQLSRADIEFIEQLIAAHPGASRRQLSALLCQAWNWVQPNGQPRDMVARSLMLELHRAGHIQLPAQRFCPPNNAARHSRPLSGLMEAELPLEAGAVECALAQLGPLEIRQVRRTAAERLFGRLLEAHHYLGYTQPVGEHLKYLVCAQGQPIACLAWSSAPRHLGPRDRFIGWSGAERRARIDLLAYNTRFLILPWVKVPHLASHLLARVAGGIAADWQGVASASVRRRKKPAARVSAVFARGSRLAARAGNPARLSRYRQPARLAYKSKGTTGSDVPALPWHGAEWR